MAQSPFINLQVQPGYGKHLAVVTWRLHKDFQKADVYVYRSDNGAQGWHLLTPQPVLGVNHFIDPELTPADRLDIVYYRILLRNALGDFPSPPVTMFGPQSKLNRLEYGGARLMLQRELERMRSGNGIQMALFIPLTRGRPSPQYDISTGQAYNMDADEANDSYGQPYVGGFHAPILTWVELRKPQPVSAKEADDLTSTGDSVIYGARMLAFPQPQANQLLVHRETDNRYAVGTDIQPYLFKGIVGIAYDVQLHLLQRTDARYRLPIPVEIAPIA